MERIQNENYREVDAKGSSVSQTDYSYKDEHLMEGIHEYRLKMVGR
jgi:hypothetical protein